MPSVVVTRFRVKNPDGERSVDDREEYQNPDALIEDGMAIVLTLERLAYADRDNPMKNAYLEMAAVYRRANVDVARIWRDVRG